jgi:CBS domain-containing protein
MNTVALVLKRKNRLPITITPDAPVLDALKLMDEKNVGSLIVMEGDKYIGILTERDYSRKVFLKGKNSYETKVSEIMSVDLPTLKPSDKIEYCMELLADKNIRYMPVFENDKFIGIISMSDVVKETILEQKSTIDHLQNYIRNS